MSLPALTDADTEVPGAPGAPLDVQCLDANKDYVIVSWKQPAVDGGSPILGYFIDRSVAHRARGLISLLLLPADPQSRR